MIECEVAREGSRALGSLEKMDRSATTSRVKQLDHIFHSLPLALRKMMCVMVVMEESIASDGIAGRNDATSGTA